MPGIYNNDGSYNYGGTSTQKVAGISRSLTVGTTAAVAMAANPNRFGWKIKNDTGSDVWINFDAAATAAPGSGNIKVAAGSYLASEPSICETGAMSIIGGAANLNVTIREY